MADHTDVGIKKKTNQDSYMIKKHRQNLEEYFSVFCVMVWADWQTEN